MTIRVRARYSEGVLTPLEPLELQDGCEVVVTINDVAETEPAETSLPALLKPFDLDTFLNDPEPKIFNPDKLVRIDLTDEEWEAFNRAIREGREA